MLYDENLNGQYVGIRWIYNMALPQKDTKDKHRKSIKNLLVDIEITKEKKRKREPRNVTTSSSISPLVK